jgi:transcriptional regulator GlxA family with amidase domain
MVSRIHKEIPKLVFDTVVFVTQNVAEDLDLQQLASACGISKFNYCRKFHGLVGLTPMRWLWSFRVSLAKEFIAIDPQWTLTDIAFACGFTSSAHFSRVFRRMYKSSPSLKKNRSFDKVFFDNKELVFEFGCQLISL